MILFLDFDGVLHPDPCMDPGRLFEHAPRLAEVLGAFPEVGVVLSTSWRNVRPREEILAALPPGVRDRVLGATPRYGELAVKGPRSPYRRQAECEAWLAEQRMDAGPWWAIDDRPDWFAPYCENLIECDPLQGLTSRVSARLASAFTMARMRAARGADLQLR